MKDYNSKKVTHDNQYRKHTAKLAELGIEITEKKISPIGITKRSHEEKKIKMVIARETKKLLTRRKRIASRRSKKSLKKGIK